MTSVAAKRAPANGGYKRQWRYSAFGRRGQALALGLMFATAVLAFQHSIFDGVLLAFDTRFERPILVENEEIGGIVSLGGRIERAQEALELAHHFPKAMLIVSGPAELEKALVLKDPSLGDRLIVDEEPKNTFENALRSKQLAEGFSNKTWLVVTSSVHMPRAIGSFEAVGLAVKPWPVHDTPVVRSEALAALEHEVLGLVYYRLLGRTKSIFPGPEPREGRMLADG